MLLESRENVPLVPSVLTFRYIDNVFSFLCSSSTEEREHEELDSSASEENVLDETSGGTYLSMEEMGVFLAYLADRGIYYFL